MLYYICALSSITVEATVPTWLSQHDLYICLSGDVPGPPGPLRVEGVGDRVLRVWWTEPDTRGSAIIAYRVWGRPQHRYDNFTIVLNLIKT